ncbi:Major facilitator superfamily multidrug-resistance DHA1 sub-family [Mycena venus]|uniref:Major facilitator superfamily multidrug-resistance DHA1 sub-family n=1 Tax=Mycena venus TaxID=2733690 RepID=A0A8H6X8L3_9AGAR|nr:Major facilitator superfamily multidrug-resistance DHA1 sub-family [Mycena venus]
MLRLNRSSLHKIRLAVALTLTPMPSAVARLSPRFQLFIVIFLQLAEPLTSQVIYPFVAQLIRDVGITHGDETKVGYYVGTMQAIFYLTQAMTVLHWSRLSDRIGRKPVILFGLMGLSLSMYCFGLSRTFWGLVVSRSLNGALNGNIGVIKSMIAEMSDATNIAQAHSDDVLQTYAYLPIAWATGGVLGSAIGGSLSHPAERFPSLFGKNDFLRKYPYFLPCAVPATFSAIAWIVTLLFLKETARGPSVLSIPHIFLRKDSISAPIDQETAVAEGGEFVGAAMVRTKPKQSSPLRGLLTRRVIVAASNYAFLALVDVAIRAMQPVFFSTPIELGGLGLPTARIGNLLTVFGLFNGVFQVFYFAKVHDYLGSKTMFIVGLASALPTFGAMPVMNYLARAQGVSVLVWAIAFVHVVLSIGLNFSYGAVFIYISAAAPNRASLGATNGLCQLSVSIMRAVGPALANSLFSLSMEKGYLHGYMVYCVLIGITCVALWVGAQLPTQPWVVRTQ